MSVVKVHKPPGPFETIDRASVEAIRDISALGLWLYLRCKPEGWIVREAQIKEQFGIGRDKYRACVRYLCALGAMEDRRVQGEHGRIIGRELVVNYSVNAGGLAVDRAPENTSHGCSNDAVSCHKPENTSHGIDRAPEKPVRRKKPSDGKSAYIENSNFLESTHQVENNEGAPKSRAHLSVIRSQVAASQDVVSGVFDYWRDVMHHPRARLDAKRKAAITARLRDGYSQQDLKLAIDGCKASPWHQGKNADGKVFDDIELICRNASKVDQFLSVLGKRSNDQAELNAWLNDGTDGSYIDGEYSHV